MTIKKSSWALSLGQNYLSIILLIEKGVEIFLWKFEISLKINNEKRVFEIPNIVKNLYIVCIIDYFSNSTLE